MSAPKTAFSENTDATVSQSILGLFDNPKDRKRLSPSAAIGARNILRIWCVPSASAAILIGVSLSTWYRIRHNQWSGSFSQDQMTRVSLLLGIYRGLQIRFGEDLARIIHQELADVVYLFEISYDFVVEFQNPRIQRPHPP
ncbi:MAG: hypothetical protein O9306_12335 [Beijerinckiaceae bacterium]|nr:hypothetical protein [Beijerinckiaceae bacterium]